MAHDILRLAGDQGFALAGFAPAGPSAQAQAVRDWVDRGHHGTMGWIEEHLDVRLDLDRLLPGAQSVIAVCDAYASEEGRGTRAKGESENQNHCAPMPLSPSTPRPTGRIARYAWGDDYHKVLKKRLHKLSDALAQQFPGAAFRTAVDTAPALEREIAARAGLGWQGKNTMLIHPRHGSYTLLGLVVTTLELPSSEEIGYPPVAGGGATVPATDHCANCTRCIDACPTDAIASEGYAIDATRCVSYLTIEHRGVIEDGLLGGLSGWIAGCDICQEVCPYNAIGKRNPLPVHERYDPDPRGFGRGLDLLDVLSWTAEDRARVFRGSALKRIKLDMMRRNALIAIGHAWKQSQNPALLEAVRVCVDDESELVAQTARRVLSQAADDGAKGAGDLGQGQEADRQA